MTAPILSFHRADRVGTVKAQELLAEKGYYASRVNGDFGAAMERCVVAFQRDHDLTLDGIVGPITWEKLAGKPKKAAKKAEPKAPEPEAPLKPTAKKAPAKKAVAKKAPAKKK